MPALFRTTAGLKARPWAVSGNFDPFVCEIIPLSGNPLDVAIFEQPRISGWEDTPEFVVVSIDNVHKPGSIMETRLAEKQACLYILKIFCLNTVLTITLCPGIPATTGVFRVSRQHHTRFRRAQDSADNTSRFGIPAEAKRTRRRRDIDRCRPISRRAEEAEGCLLYCRQSAQARWRWWR